MSRPDEGRVLYVYVHVCMYCRYLPHTPRDATVVVLASHEALRRRCCLAGGVREFESAESTVQLTQSMSPAFAFRPQASRPLPVHFHPLETNDMALHLEGRGCLNTCYISRCVT